MSDVRDVHNAHLESEPPDDLALYVKAARRVTNGQQYNSTDYLAFMSFHSAKNVARLGDLIDHLRVENSILLDQMYGTDRHD